MHTYFSGLWWSHLFPGWPTKRGHGGGPLNFFILTFDSAIGSLMFVNCMNQVNVVVSRKACA